MRKVVIASVNTNNKYGIKDGQIYIAADGSKGGHLVLDVAKYANCGDVVTQAFTASGLSGPNTNRIDGFKLSQVRYCLVEGKKIPSWVPEEILALM
jgi:hypothetical protein